MCTIKKYICVYILSNNDNETGAMAQEVKALATKPENLSSTQGTDIVKENQLPKLSSDLYTCHSMHVPTYTHTKYII